MSELSINGISINFGGLRALNCVTFGVQHGKIVGLIGPNGSGKTTLFNIITGFVAPTVGTVIYNGQELTGMASHRIAKLGIARTFQGIRLFGRMTVLDNVLIAQDIHAGPSLDTLVGIHGRNERQLRREAEELLAFFGLWDRRFERAASLPFGDQHRLEIARALATRAEMLLLDEPAAGMNPVESEHLLTQLRGINKLGKTIVVIEHDMSVIMGLCDNIVVLNFGEKIAEDTSQGIQNNPVVLEAYLGKELDVTRRKRRKN